MKNTGTQKRKETQMKKIAVGIDVGGTSVKMGLFSNDGSLLKKWEIETRKGHNGDFIFHDIAESVKGTLRKENIGEENIIGAGMGIPGPVNDETGYVEICPNLELKDACPSRELSAYLGGMKVILANDANVAALGETWKGAAQGYKDVLLVTLGTGIGGGLVLNGEIRNGKHGLAGEIGHTHVRDEETEICGCGGRGCLEQVSSATGIVREAKRMMAAGTEPSEMRAFGDRLAARDVCNLAKAGDNLANRALQISCRYLGLALSHAAMTVDPEVFVIGGGVSRAGTFLIQMIQPYYEEYLPLSREKSEIMLAQLGNDAGIYGGARLILQNGK